LDAFPRQPQSRLVQEISSSPNISIASVSESDALETFRWKLMLWPPLGHSNTTLNALLTAHNTISHMRHDYAQRVWE